MESLPKNEIIAAGRKDPAEYGIRVDGFIPADLNDRTQLTNVIDKSGSDVVVNFAARTDVDGCEKERPGKITEIEKEAKPGSAWLLNGVLPGWVAEEVENRHLFLVHLSTDFVFAGEEGPYPESALPDSFGPKVSWYGYTKGIGEAQVLSHARERSSILRISYPYRSAFAQKMDFARYILSKSKDGTLPPLYTDQMITPTWIPDVTRAIRAVVRLRTTGTYHLASPLVTTPYAFAVVLFGEMGMKNVKIESSLLQGHPARGRAPRPLQGGLGISRIHSLGIEPLSYRDGIKTLAAELKDPQNQEL